MGIFGKSKKAAQSGHVGNFVSPHSAEETLKVVYSGLVSQLSEPSPSTPAPFQESTPGVMAGIYLSRLTPTSLVVTAGNTIETYFEFHVDLTPVSGGVEGRAYLDRPFNSIQRWMGNAIHIVSGVNIACTQASIRTVDWYYG